MEELGGAPGMRARIGIRTAPLIIRDVQERSRQVVYQAGFQAARGSASRPALTSDNNCMGLCAPDMVRGARLGVGAAAAGVGASH